MNSSDSFSYTNSRRNDTVLITGGAGFVGTNLATRLLSSGRRVIIFDNLVRRGVEQNLRLLQEKYSDRLQFIRGDVRDSLALAAAVSGVSQVYHFAAQVAVTTSLVDPIADFEVNARGILNLLEALRVHNPEASLVFTSTNKVYGHLEDVALVQSALRYQPQDNALARYGIGENRSIHFHSPYGCSKGAADQYVLDYAHTFGIRAAVFRMSCIYGPHQFGNEDQGWVAHFILRALSNEPITLYGDGRQVRDILYVEDLVNALVLVQERMSEATGKVYNIGGGPGNAISLLELTEIIAEIRGQPLELNFAEWRTADQRYYVSDVRRFTALAGWRPQVSAAEGVERLYRWMAEHRVHPRGIPAKEEVASSFNLNLRPRWRAKFQDGQSDL